MPWRACVSLASQRRRKSKHWSLSSVSSCLAVATWFLLLTMALPHVSGTGLFSNGTANGNVTSDAAAAATKAGTRVATPADLGLSPLPGSSSGSSHPTWADHVAKARRDVGSAPTRVRLGSVAASMASASPKEDGGADPAAAGAVAAAAMAASEGTDQATAMRALENGGAARLWEWLKDSGELDTMDLKKISAPVEVSTIEHCTPRRQHSPHPCPLVLVLGACLAGCSEAHWAVA